MAELHVQIDKNDIEYQIFAYGYCSDRETYEASISPNTIGSIDTIKVTDYRCYIQGLSSYYEKNKTKIIDRFNLSSVSDLSLELIIHISGNKIQLLDTNGDETSLFYTIDEHNSKRDVNVYFNKQDKEPYDIPILFKYGERFFAPKDKNSYFTRWNVIKESENFTESNSIELNNYINGVYNKLTEVVISQTSDYGIPFNGNTFFVSDDKTFSTKRFSLSKNNKGKNYKTVTHKHCSVDSVQHKPRIGNICSFNGCKFDNEHITVVKNDNIDEVVVLFHKDDSSCKYPKLVLLNKYSKTYGSTTYGYYNINKTPDNCKGYEFKNIPKGCGFDDILGDYDTIDCSDGAELRQLISSIPQKPADLNKQYPDDCKCSGTAVEVQTPDHGSDGSNGEVVEEKEVIDEGTDSEFSKKPVSLSHKITFKQRTKPKDAKQYVNREVKTKLNYTKIKYTSSTFGRNSSESGPWNLYADTFFRLGTKTKNCGSSRQPRNSRCEFYKFKVSDHIIESFYEKEFYSIDVFFHTQPHLALLIQFGNGTIKHIIRTSRNDDKGWKILDKPLDYKNDGQLLKSLNQIEFNLDTFLLLIDKESTYTTTEIQKAIQKTYPTLGVSPYQSTSISVSPKDLFESKYKQCVHTIYNVGVTDSRSSYPLRLFMSDGSEVELYDSSAKRKEKLEYTSGLRQNTVDVYLVKSSTKLIPVLISYNGKVYQQKTDDKKTAKTNICSHKTQVYLQTTKVHSQDLRIACSYIMSNHNQLPSMVLQVKQNLHMPPLHRHRQ
ncbi:hypothetical protein MACK_000422 [Theileria orientalis]|uniref:Uncharacterized protein n=1 Tax=Theileria orientalis TaxID=68886 RepID=A0A976MBI1_THEOR|nr:hypothetical protein MACK_000422 [Theileria orientalis]